MKRMEWSKNIKFKKLLEYCIRLIDKVLNCMISYIQGGCWTTNDQPEYFEFSKILN